MKFYQTVGADGLIQLVNTQIEAKDADPNFAQTEVPTDKDGLKGYINDLYRQIHEQQNAGNAPAADDEDAEDEAEAKSAAPAPAATQAPATMNFERIQDWIFDHASPGQIESLFTALGARFHEMRKALTKRAGTKDE